MKKLTLFFATLLSVAVLFTACPPGGPGKEKGTPMNYWDGMFYSNHVDSENDHPYGEYSVVFMTGNLDVDDQGAFTGEGDALSLQIVAPEATSAQIPAGSYPVVDFTFENNPTQNMLVAGWEYDALAEYGMPGVYLVPVGTYIFRISATDTLTKYVVGGEMTVAYEGEGNLATINMDVTFDDNTTAKYTFNGALNISTYEWPEPEDPYEYESTEATQQTIAFTSCEMQYDSQYSCWLLKAQKDEYMLGATFYSDNATDATGTYTVSDSNENGTMTASPGAEDGYVYYSFWGTTDEDGYIVDIWFIASGTLTVNGSNFTGNFTSHFGSTLQASYTAAEAAPAYSKAPANIKPFARKAGVSRSLIQRPACLK